MTAHPPEACVGETCCVHQPSDHHMVGWPTVVRHGKLCLTERVCPCGIGHPDPDSLAWLERVWPSLIERGLTYDGPDGWKALGVHGCCGCCRKGRSA